MGALSGYTVNGGGGTGTAPAAPAAPSTGGTALKGFTVGAAAPTPVVAAKTPALPSGSGTILDNNAPAPDLSGDELDLSTKESSQGAPETPGAPAPAALPQPKMVSQLPSEQSSPPVSGNPIVRAITGGTTLKQFTSDALGDVPTASQEVSSAIINTPASWLSDTPFIKNWVNAADNKADTPEGMAANTFTGVLGSLSAYGTSFFSGVTGGMFQAPADSQTDQGSTFLKYVNDGLSVVGQGLGAMESIGTIAKYVGAIATPSSLVNFLGQFPTVAKYAIPLIQNAVGFATYSQLNPQLANNFGDRAKQLAIAIGTAPLYTALGAISDPKYSMPASFGLGFGMAKLSGASNQDAFASGMAFGLLDGVGRAGAEPFVDGRQVDQALEAEAYLTLSRASGMDVNAKSSPEDVQKAYRAAAKATHPDLGGTQKDFVAVQSAYDYLQGKSNTLVKSDMPNTADQHNTAEAARRLGAGDSTEKVTMDLSSKVEPEKAKEIVADAKPYVDQAKAADENRQIQAKADAAAKTPAALDRTPGDFQNDLTAHFAKQTTELKPYTDKVAELQAKVDAAPAGSQEKKDAKIALTAAKESVATAQAGHAQATQSFLGESQGNFSKELAQSMSKATPGERADVAKSLMENATNAKKAIANRTAKFKDIAQQVAKENAAQKPELHTGAVYRAESGFKNDRGTTAADVVRHEQEELGNELGVPERKIEALEKRPASDVVWVTSTKQDARRYGKDVTAMKAEGWEVIARDKDKGMLLLKPEETKTQKDKVKEALEKKTEAKAGDIARETKILEPNVRRILGMGAKDGTFERVGDGVYRVKTADGKDVAVVIPGDAVDTLPKLAAEGFKADMVFLDIPYDTKAIRGGNRGANNRYDLITPEQFDKVLKAVSDISRTNKTPVFYMFSQAKSGLKDMQKYMDIFDKYGFVPVARGQWQKLYENGKPVGFPTNQGYRVTEPEGIIMFNKTGEIDGKNPPNLSFSLVRPKGYHTEKPAAMLRSLIEMSTKKGDVVLDPFAGSGVTAEQAVATGRKAVAIEKDKEQAKKIAARAQAAVPNDTETPKDAEDAAQKYYDAVIKPRMDAGQAIIIGADDLKDHFGNDYDPANHAMYSKAADMLFHRAVEESKNDLVKFTMGGAGAGKSDFVVPHAADDFDGVVYDSTGWKYEGIKNQIDFAKSQGKDVRVYGIIPDIDVARAYTLQREANGEHPVSEDAFVRTHVGAVKTMIHLINDGVDVRVLDSRGMQLDKDEIKGNAQFELSPLDKLQNAAYDDEHVREITKGITKENVAETIRGAQQRGQSRSQNVSQENGASGAGEIEGEQPSEADLKAFHDQQTAAAEQGERVPQNEWERAGFSTKKEMESAMRDIREYGESQKEQTVRRIIAGKINFKPDPQDASEWKEILGSRYYRVFKKNAGLSVDAKASELGYGNGEELKDAVSDEVFRRFNKAANQRGFINYGLMAEAAAKPIKDVKDFIDNTQHSIEIVGNFEEDTARLRGNSQAAMEEAIQILRAAQAKKYTQEEYANVRRAIEAPLNPKAKAPELTAREKELKSDVDALQKASATMEKYNEKGGFAGTDTGYLRRFAIGYNNPITDLLNDKSEARLNIGSLLSQSDTAFKHRVMHALTDEKGNRRVAAIKNTKFTIPKGKREGDVIRSKRVTGFDGDKKPVDLGRFSMKTRAQLMESETKPVEKKLKTLQVQVDALTKVKVNDIVPLPRIRAVQSKVNELIDYIDSNVGAFTNKELQPDLARLRSRESELKALHTVRAEQYAKGNSNADKQIAGLQDDMREMVNKLAEIEANYNPENLDQHVFKGNDGHTYTVGDATVDEIQAQTNQRYHDNALLSATVQYLKASRVNMALHFVEALTKSPAYADVIKKDDGKTPKPDGWRVSKMPQFRTYFMEPHLADAVDDMYGWKNDPDAAPDRIIMGIAHAMTDAVFYNPVVHPLFNTGSFFAVDRGSELFKPQEYKTNVQAFAKALAAVKDKNSDYMDALRAGFPFRGTNVNERTLGAAFQKIIENTLDQSPSSAEIAKKFGFKTIMDMKRAIGNAYHSATFIPGDILSLQSTYARMAEKGMTFEDAMRDTFRFQPSYKVPSRVLGSRWLSQAIQSPLLSFAGAYHYAIPASMLAIARDIVAPKEGFSKGGWKARGDAAGKGLMLAFLGIIATQWLDHKIQGLLNNPWAYGALGGEVKFVGDIDRVANGDESVSQLIQALVMPSPFLEAATEGIFNRDMYTGNPIWGEGGIGTGAYLESTVAPLQAAGEYTPEDMLLQFANIHNPSTGLPKLNVDTMIYDEKPTLDTQIKKELISGDTATAKAQMDDFNQRLVSYYQQALLQEGKQPLNQSQITAFLKANGVTMPGAVAMANAEKLYPDGTATKPSTLLQTVATYAEAIGTDPQTAFNRIFTGQQIVRVDSPGLLNPDGAVIVQRMPEAASETVRAQDAAAGNISSSTMAGLQLDHVIALELGGTNAASNLNLITTQQNEVENPIVENFLATALTKGQVSRANIQQYIIRYKAGTLGEQLPAPFMAEYKNEYNSQPLSAQQIFDLVNSGKAK